VIDDSVLTHDYVICNFELVQISINVISVYSV